MYLAIRLICCNSEEEDAIRERRIARYTLERDNAHTNMHAVGNVLQNKCGPSTCSICSCV